MKWSAVLHVVSLLAASILAHGLCALASPFARFGVLAVVGVLGAIAAATSAVHRGDGGHAVQRIQRGVVMFGVAVGAAGIVVWGSDQLAMRQVSLPSVGWLVGTVLQPFGDFAATATGEVGARARDGRLLFDITTVKLGVMLLAFGAAYGVTAAAAGRLRPVPPT